MEQIQTAVPDDPQDKPLQTRQERARLYMADHGITQKRFGQLVGVEESTISRWFKGDYPSPDNINAKVDELLDKEHRRRVVKSADEIEYAETQISQKIWNLLDYCQAQRCSGCVYGDAGVGKTFTTREWSRKRTDTVVLTVAPAVKSMKAVLKRLARLLKVKPYAMLDELYADLEEKLTGMDVTVIIDEAQHLSYGTVENIRILADTTRTPVIFVGNELVHSKLLGNQSAEFAQVFSRLYMKRHLLTDQFVMDDIISVFGGIESDTAQLLLRVARSKYGLRGAVILYTNAQNNNDITEKGLKAMAGVMGITV
jgi:DNA transposition AAA+ family ATPase